MPDPDFPNSRQVIGKHDHTDGQHFHFVWGPGSPSDAAVNPDVKAAYEARNEELAPIGVHGTFVAVDWDSCIAGLHTSMSSKRISMVQNRK